MKIRQQKKNGRLIPVMDTDLADFPKERWKGIPDFENYQLSNYGRVKSVRRFVEMKNGKTVLKSERVLKLRIMRISNLSKTILIQMILVKDGVYYSFSVIRMVYALFVAPIDIYDLSIVVKKKDNDPLNCHFRNLRLQLSIKATKDGFDIPDKKGIVNKKLRAEYPNVPIMNTELGNLPGEKWKYIPGFEDKNQLSNYGRVKNVARNVHYSNGRIVSMPERIHSLRITPMPRNPNEIIITVLLLNGNSAHVYSIPRLVYNVFVTPFDMNDLSLVITKKDTDNLNCYYKNLRLQTISNLRTETYAAKGVENVLRGVIKPVHQYDKDGVFLCSHPSVAKASIATKIGVVQIKSAIHGKRLQGKKYYWVFGDPKHRIDLLYYREKKQQYLLNVQRQVQKLSSGGKVLETYPSITNATQAMGFKSNNSIKQACAKKNGTSGGYRWRFVEQQYRNKRKDAGKPKKVHQYTLEGKYVNSYPSVADAAESVHIVASAITKAARLKYNTANDFYWRFGDLQDTIDVSAFKDKSEKSKYFRKKPVQKFTLNGRPLKIYESMAMAANELKIGSSGISFACKNFNTACKGFRWRFVE